VAAPPIGTDRGGRDVRFWKILLIHGSVLRSSAIPGVDAQTKHAAAAHAEPKTAPRPLASIPLEKLDNARGRIRNPRLKAALHRVASNATAITPRGFGENGATATLSTGRFDRPRAPHKIVNIVTGKDGQSKLLLLIGYL